jgi:cell division protein ZapA (FtsZ GTPase activity inhibitor)
MQILIHTDKITRAAAIMIADDIQKHTGKIETIVFEDCDTYTMHPKIAIAVVWRNELKMLQKTTNDDSLAMALIAFEDYYRSKK